MKPTTYLILLLLITSCSAPKLYQKGLNKINKAIAKDPSIKLPSDTTVVVKTKVKIDTVDNEIIKTVTNTITVKVDTCEFDQDLLKTTRQLRFERRILNDSLDHLARMYKLETRRLQDSLKAQQRWHSIELKKLRDINDTNKDIAKIEHKSSPFLRFVGRMWWLMLLIGFVGGLYVKRFIPKLPFLNNTKDG